MECGQYKPETKCFVYLRAALTLSIQDLKMSVNPVGERGLDPPQFDCWFKFVIHLHNCLW